MSTLPSRFTLGELQDIIVAANASPLGVVGLLLREHGATAEFTRDEFMEHGLRQATGYNSTHTGTAAQLADLLEEIFEAGGSRGGFMIGHSQDARRDLLLNVTGLLVPELQRRGRFRTHYEGNNLRENLAT
jgi:alkanesulfonate monooxygenase SsuD/methylene tetrahydromethanopterin reductase-like flavin-dependent oxidoreductase (luciferase family)